jgi:hypothetical protein
MWRSLSKLPRAPTTLAALAASTAAWSQQQQPTLCDDDSAKSDNNANASKERKKYTAAEEYPHFTEWHTSLMRKHLTPEIFAQLHNKQTKNGYTLENVIANGVAAGFPVPRGMGCMAGDYASYDIFAPLFDPIIREYHNFKDFKKHVTDLNPNHLKVIKNIDPQGSYVLSTRIRVARSIEGFSFPAGCSRGERREIEALAKSCVENLSGDLQGMYISLNSMDNDENDDLIQRHVRLISSIVNEAHNTTNPHLLLFPPSHYSLDTIRQP